MTRDNPPITADVAAPEAIASLREHLNFSAWDRYPARKRARKLHEVAEAVSEGGGCRTGPI